MAKNKLKAGWTLETVQDMQCYHGQSLSEVAEQFRKEVDQEVIAEIVKQTLAGNPPVDEMDEFNALLGLQYNKPRSPPVIRQYEVVFNGHKPVPRRS
jgi:hypothetical protein